MFTTTSVFLPGLDGQSTASMTSVAAVANAVQVLPGMLGSLRGDGASATDIVAPPAPGPGGRILTVGAGQEYSTVSAAIAASHDGDVIEVQAGTYVNDTATINDNITLVGFGGMVNMVETQDVPNGKAILVANDGLNVYNFAFSGAQTPDSNGGNAAGIRLQGGNLNVVNDGFFNNQDGILVGALSASNITISHSDFADNGNSSPSAPGLTHDLYIGAINSLTVTDSAFLGTSNDGHDFKSRAMTNAITGNVISDLDSDASYSVDLPNGGNDTLNGNFIEQGPKSPNHTIIAYSEDGLPYAGSQLILQGNTIVNLGGASAVMVANYSGLSDTISGNTIEGVPAANLSTGRYQASGNVDGSGAAIADSSSNSVLNAGGSNTVFTDSAAHTVDVTKQWIGIEGGGGLLTVNDPLSHITVIGGSGGLDFVESGAAGASSITTAAGATDTLSIVGAMDTITSQGTDTITLGSGNTTLTLTGASTVQSGTGTDHYTIEGQDQVTAQGGADFFSLYAGSKLTLRGVESFAGIFSIGGNLSLDATVGRSAFQASIEGGSWTLTAGTGGALALTTNSGGRANSATIDLTTGNYGVVSRGADTIYFGSGDSTVQLNAAGANIIAGTGQLTVYAHGNGMDAVWGNGGDYMLTGSGGNITYEGGALASTVEAQVSNVVLNGGAGLMTVNGGSRDIVLGGSGGIVVNRVAASTITTAAGSANTLNLTSAAGDTVYSHGNDTINLGTVPQLVTAYGNASMTGASVTATLFGDDSYVQTADAWSTLTVGQGATANLSLIGFYTINETGGTVNLNYTGGSAHDSLRVTGGQATIAGNPGVNPTVTTAAAARTEIDIATGPATVTMKGANDLVHGGAGLVIVNVAGGGSVAGGAGGIKLQNASQAALEAISVTGGAGAVSLVQNAKDAMTFIGGAGSAAIASFGGALFVTGGSGSISLSSNAASGGFVTYAGGSGSATLGLSAAGGDITFGSGATTVTEAAKSAAVTYHFLSGYDGASDIITGFKAGTDKLVLQGVSVSSETVAGGSAYVTLSDHTSIKFAGLAMLPRFS